MTARRREAYLVVDLGFGDAGKGTVTDFLVRRREAHTVLRFNGGAQAGHNVVTPDGRHHTFAQFGAGSFVPGVRTHLTKHMVVHPLALVTEAEHLRTQGVGDALERLFIDREALAIAPFQQAANRLRELCRGDARHGSCGVGVGEAVSDALELGADALRMGDLDSPEVLLRKLRALQARKREALTDALRAARTLPEAAPEVALLDDTDAPARIATRWTALREDLRLVDEARLRATLAAPGAVIFEGAQGVLLDEWRGFHPYTTWSTCTPDNARSLLTAQHYDGEVTTLGVLRSYSSRHGAGPLPTEDAGFLSRCPEAHNGLHPWQGAFRAGPLDLVLTRYALAASRTVDALAVTHLDRVATNTPWPLGTRYEDTDTLPLGPFADLTYQESLTTRLTATQPVLSHAVYPSAEAFVTTLEDALGLPVTLTSAGPTCDHKNLRKRLK